MSDELKLEGVKKQGYGNIPKLVMKDPNLSIEAKSIYAYFCSYAGGGETKVFPSVSLICKDLCISENRLIKHRKMLFDRGYVSVKRIRNKDGKGWSKNIYTIHDFVHIQNVGIQNEGVGNEGIQNEGTNKNSSNNNINNKNSINRTGNKKVYGEFKNVNLTDDELIKLKSSYDDYQKRIESLSTYLNKKGEDKYKSHYKVILSWARKEKKNPTPRNKNTIDEVFGGLYGDKTS